ncbi:unnamed protein product [Lactuca virosa]|uniref:Uncharacterized protein n=1 Tax=Lactuca virosa TaxID=75947 RepID=A0AAU9N0L2_9ASTR|nr:unnamed protein product [Lactuca virosa]
MKVACVAASVEGDRQAVKEHVASRRFNPQEPSVLVKLTQSMHTSVMTFMETDVASLLHLGELNLEGLRQFCRDPDVEEKSPEGNPLKVGSSSTTLVK